jgi:NAD-dependent deacetylase
MATFAAFSRMPEEVWRWYLYRRSVCRGAQPNAAHRALATLEEALQDRFILVTQNVDGLHLRAGNSLDRTYQIHGNIDYLRCGDDPGSLRPIPVEIGEHWTRESVFTDEARARLSCCEGGALSRPHVLWFDECYDEALFRFESSIRAATSASLLIVIGTSGATNLPMQVGSIVAQRGAPMVVVNRDPNPFSRFAEASGNGVFIEGRAGDHLPSIVQYLCTGAHSPGEAT